MTDSETTSSAPKQTDQIRADRACIGCGFNLFGQTVTKEEHYGLAITRCPECGEVAALQSYPTMSHWVNRFRVILATLWILLFLGVFVLSTMITMGITAGATDVSIENLADHIGSAQEVWVLEQARVAQDQAGVSEASAPTNPTSTTAGPTTVTTTTNGMTTTVTTAPDGSTTTTINGMPIGGGGFMGSYRWSMINDQWRDEQMGQSIQAAGGVWANLDREFMILYIPMSILASAAGIFWSVTMLGARRRRVVWVPLISGLIAGTLAITINMSVGSSAMASEIAKSLATPIVVPMMIGIQMLFACIGIFLGRKTARGVVLMCLPPRARVSLSLLWTSDGLELPKPKIT